MVVLVNKRISFIENRKQKKIVVVVGNETRSDFFSVLCHTVTEPTLV